MISWPPYLVTIIENNALHNLYFLVTLDLGGQESLNCKVKKCYGQLPNDDTFLLYSSCLQV